MATYPGTAAMDWLGKVPTCLVNVCLGMLPILDSEAKLAAVTAVQIGTGTMPADQATPILERWNFLAFPAPPEALRKPDPTILQQHGIPVRRVKKRRSEA